MTFNREQGLPIFKQMYKCELKTLTKRYIEN